MYYLSCIPNGHSWSIKTLKRSLPKTDNHIRNLVYGCSKVSPVFRYLWWYCLGATYLCRFASNIVKSNLNVCWLYQMLIQIRIMLFRTHEVPLKLPIQTTLLGGHIGIFRGHDDTKGFFQTHKQRENVANGGCDHKNGIHRVSVFCPLLSYGFNFIIITSNQRSRIQTRNKIFYIWTWFETGPSYV